MNLVIYQFNKKRNSTKRPDQAAISSGLTFNSVYLKEPTSFNNPTFLISSDKDLSAYNYISFNGNYYYIADCKSVANDRWEIDCNFDSLASLKNYIVGSTVYAEYMTGGSSDILDSRIVPTSNYTIKKSETALSISQTGRYIVGTVGSSGVNYYSLTGAQLRKMLSSITGLANIRYNLTPAEASVQWFKDNISLGGASQAIRSCIWVPFIMESLPGIDAAPVTVEVGTFNSTASGYLLSSAGTYVSAVNTSVSIPFTRSGFVRLQPFTDINLYLPFIGNININNPAVVLNSTINIRVSINILSGDISYYLSIGAIPIGSYGASTCCDIGTGVSNVSPMKAFNSILSGVASAAYGNIAGAVGAAANAIAPTITSVGGCSGAAGAGLPTNIICTVTEHEISDGIGAFNNILGNPAFKHITITDNMGYLQTKNASISAGIFRSDIIDDVNNMLDSGVYIE